MQQAIREAYQAVVGSPIPLGPYPPLWDVRDDVEHADTISIRGAKPSTPTTAPVVARDANAVASRAQRKRRVLFLALLCGVAGAAWLAATGTLREHRAKLTDVVDTMVSALPPLGAESAAPAEVAPGAAADEATADEVDGAAIAAASPEDSGAVPPHPPVPRTDHASSGTHQSSAGTSKSTVHKSTAPTKHTKRKRP